MYVSMQAFGQADYTSRITNPSFEKNGFNGWTQSNMQTQENSVFNIKQGNVYVEKWTGRGGAVGSGTVYQVLSDLPPGNYEMTAAAQNIQEDTPEAAQTGAWIFAGDQRTAVTVRGTYTVAFTHVTGEITIGFEAASASGNWIAVDNFRLTRVGEGLAEAKQMLQDKVGELRTLYGDGAGTDANLLLQAITQAEQVLNDEATTSEAVVAQLQRLEEAERTYRLANASPELPYDMTSSILNPSFEDGWTGWTHNDMQTQGNDAFTLKQGSTYVEKWVGQGNAVGNGSVTQHVTGLPNGRFIVKAAAQNIQEGSATTHRTGAYLVGEYQQVEVGVRAEYSVEFVTVTGDANIGFVAENAKGNWIAVDNFRLYFIGSAIDAQNAEMSQRIADAEALAGEKMNATVRQQLLDAIEAARQALAVGDGNYAASAINLRWLTEAAEASITAYANLLKAIEEANGVIVTGKDNGLDAFQTTIAEAQALYDNPEAQNDALAQMIGTLQAAAFAYRVANGTGTAPKVTTDPRYVRGAIEAFGRMTVSGISTSQILEQGFCWATHPEPTVLDKRSTDYLEHNGRIYRMGMEPATVYYIRAYAMTKNYAVGYGDVIKISTLPMGNVTYTYYNNDGGDFHYNKNTNALNEACWYWSNYTSISGFHVTANYSPGTPTADCGYGGGMRIGSNTGQRTGTMMHEMNHGIGGGTIEVWGGWSDSFLRTSINGDWAGERANGVIRFWENRDDITITGAYDGAHWGLRETNGAYSQSTWCDKYAFNGSHLEAGNWAGPSNWNDTQIVYIGNSLIQQGMCEDGLVPVNYYAGGFCLPAYVFPHDDAKKYYIKNESKERGFNDSYLTEGKLKKVTWTVPADSDVTANDSAAWYISFDPQKQYYSFRNAATGNYLTYASGMKTVSHATPTAADKFHLMRGRKDVAVGNDKVRGYWIIYPQGGTPPALSANAGGAVAAANVDLYDRAAQQRWIFVSEDEVPTFESGVKDNFLNELDELIAQIRKLQKTPHREDVTGIDNQVTTDLARIEQEGKTCTTADEVKALIAEARMAGIDFLSSATPTDINRPFDLTFMIVDAAFNTNEGWTGGATFSNSCGEFFEKSFNFYQTVTGLPQGTFKFQAQAFQRPGSADATYANFAGGTNDVTTWLYAGAGSAKICHIGEGAQTRRLHDDDVEVGNPTRYIPNTMASAAAYFKKKLYDNAVYVTTTQKDTSMKVGLRCSSSKSGYWTIFDNFRLYFYGSISEDVLTGIEQVESDATMAKDADSTIKNATYDLSGRRITDDSQHRAIVIQGGKKVVAK
ncbi:MAG: hypothetical protein IJ197_01385 [Bacteroidaceae bacterium]|nr:hypothetical protein [Bacteroidaceae bacterium]